MNRYKEKARLLLTSEEGLKHRGRRCIEPEALFGQMKQNLQYKRFRNFGKDKVTMDFAFFAIAFNIKKLCSKIAKMRSKGGNNTFFAIFKHITLFKPLENLIFCKFLENRVFIEYQKLTA